MDHCFQAATPSSECSKTFETERAAPLGFLGSGQIASSSALQCVVLLQNLGTPGRLSGECSGDTATLTLSTGRRVNVFFHHPVSDAELRAQYPWKLSPVCQLG